MPFRFRSVAKAEISPLQQRPQYRHEQQTEGNQADAAGVEGLAEHGRIKRKTPRRTLIRAGLS